MLKSFVYLKFPVVSYMILVLFAYAGNKISDEPAQICSLAGAVTAHKKNRYMREGPGPYIRVATQYPYQNSQTLHLLFPDFRHFLDPFGRPILAIFIHRQLKTKFIQIILLADLIFTEKFQTRNIRKGIFLTDFFPMFF